jgi:hypothetical protein
MRVGRWPLLFRESLGEIITRNRLGGFALILAGQRATIGIIIAG